METVLAHAAEALREVAGESFEVEVSAGEVSGGEFSGRHAGDGKGNAPREVGLLTVRRGPDHWDFRAQEVGRLTKERAAQLLSSTEFTSGLEQKEGSEEAGRKASVFVSEHVTGEAGRLLRSKGICYLDAGGNCYLRQGLLLAFVRGQETAEEVSSERPTRAFNATGLKLIFVLLARQEAAGWTYRRLSKVAGVSRGAVGYVLEDLRRLGFLEEIGGERRLRKRPELLERWTEQFAERLRPKLGRGRFRFTDEDARVRWRDLKLESRKTQWGGEPAADLLGYDLRPKQFPLYTKEDTSQICRELGLAPKEGGSVEILDMFWDPGRLRYEDRDQGRNDPQDARPEGVPPTESVPPILTYADLIAGADPRGVEAARRIREKHLHAK